MQSWFVAYIGFSLNLESVKYRNDAQSKIVDGYKARIKIQVLSDYH